MSQSNNEPRERLKLAVDVTSGSFIILEREGKVDRVTVQDSITSTVCSANAVCISCILK